METTPGRLAGTAEPFLLWHFFLLTSLSDAAAFSLSGSLLTTLNFDNPSCWQLPSRKPDTLSPDKLLSLLSLLPYSLDSTFLFPSSLSTLPYSLHFPSLWKPLVFSLLYSFRFSILFTLHFPILCTSRLFLLFTSLLSSFPFATCNSIQSLWTQKFFAHRNFYTKYFYTWKLLHTEAFTYRSAYA